MIKVSYFIRRLPGWTPQAFLEYWRKSHAALIRRHAETFGIVRYVQIHPHPHPRNEPSAAFPNPCDGIAELWFRDEAGVNEWFENRSAAARAAGKAIRADERKFIDRAHSPLLVGREEPII